MTDTIDNAQELLLKGNFSASLAMYSRLYQGPGSDEDRGTAAAMLSQMYACGMTGPVNEKMADDFLAKAIRLQNPLGLFFVESRDPDITSADFEKLVKKLRKMAEEGNTFAMMELGLIYEHGHHKKADLKKALAWYEKAASLGHVDAMVRAGWIWENDSFAERDEHKAFTLYLKSAAMEYGNGEFQLGCCFRDGIGTERDIRKAVTCFEKASAHGSREADTALWDIYTAEGLKDEEGHTLYDPEKGFSHLRLAAQRGDEEALMGLGSSYFRGTGTEVNLEKAEQCFQKAWAAGNTMAGTMLGILYVYGYGSPDDEVKGTSYLKQAAMEGDSDAFRELAVCLLHGRGVAQDVDQGLQMLENLAEGKDPMAFTVLGNWYVEQRDPEKALENYKKAADLGEPKAEYALAHFYLAGTVVPRNLRKAQELLQRAAMKGEKQAEEDLKSYF
ncbi:tetratricopeptide repeat protein [Dialister sp.]|uniref:tetratricopeptide repeat protein n=1 Tax=Dialister sp. TaxID=1955814 RepID=UPI003F07466E